MLRADKDKYLIKSVNNGTTKYEYVRKDVAVLEEEREEAVIAFASEHPDPPSLFPLIPTATHQSNEPILFNNRLM